MGFTIRKEEKERSKEEGNRTAKMEGRRRGEGGTAKENGRQQRKVGSTGKERRKKDEVR